MSNPPTQGREILSDREREAMEDVSKRAAVGLEPFLCREAAEDAWLAAREFYTAAYPQQTECPELATGGGPPSFAQQTEGDEREWTLEREFAANPRLVANPDLVPGERQVLVQAAALTAAEQRAREAEAKFYLYRHGYDENVEGLESDRDRLQRENERLREALEAEWESNHVEHCTNVKLPVGTTDRHEDGSQCHCPRPAALDSTAGEKG